VSVIVQITKNFKNTAKPLLKKYPSLQKDLLRLEAELINNPILEHHLVIMLIKSGLKFPVKERGKAVAPELFL